MKRGSISSELLMYGGGVRCILLLSLVAICRDNRSMYMARLFLCML